MEKLTALKLIETWEQGLAATPLERALLILSVASPNESWEALSRISIGDRDARLFKLRKETFGSRMQALCDCPHCGDLVEMSFLVEDMLVGPPAKSEASYRLTVDGCEVNFRLPDSRDLAAVAAVPDRSVAARQLFCRCVIDARRRGNIISPDKLSPAVMDAAAKQMAQADAQSNIDLEITCPVCQNSWTSLFDIVSFFWSEISTEARRLLRDIHALASAYGWNEETILALSPARRQAYLEMAGG